MAELLLDLAELQELAELLALSELIVVAELADWPFRQFRNS